MAAAHRFTNRDRLRRRLKAIPAKVRQAVRAQLKVNALELVETAKSFAPVDTGFLREHIRAQNVSTSTRIAWRVGSYALHSRWVEFGTAPAAARPARQNMNFRRTAVMTKAYAAHHATPAQPFFWPAWRLKRRRFKLRMSRAVRKAIQEGAAA